MLSGVLTGAEGIDLLDAINTGHGVPMWFESAVARHPSQITADLSCS